MSVSSGLDWQAHELLLFLKSNKDNRYLAASRSKEVEETWRKVRWWWDTPGLWKRSLGSLWERRSGCSPSYKTCTCCRHRIPATFRTPMSFLCSTSNILPSCSLPPLPHICELSVPICVNPRNLTAMPMHSSLDNLGLVLLPHSIFSPPPSPPPASITIPPLTTNPWFDFSFLPSFTQEINNYLATNCL